jgi:transcriptional regulator with XRE-family HTH domain
LGLAMETAPEIDGVALRAAREKAGLTQHELARVVGVVGGERVAMWERGRSRPRSPRILHAVAAAVGVPARSLLVPPEDGPTLRWLRFAAGLGVDQVADAARVSISSLKRWEAGSSRRALPPETVQVLAAVLGVRPGEVSAALRRP